MKQHPRLVIAGTHSGVGKTTATLAILAALRERGRRVQPFKAGPDFIDPSHHQAATGRQSRNLDGWMLGAQVNREIFTRAAEDADISVIEGMMGLFDGSSSVSDRGSTAELAKQLDAPVILVIDGSALARSAAAMVAGYARFDPAVHVRGVVFNRVGSDGHYKLLKIAVEHETDVKALGYLCPDSELTINDRHLGLTMAQEQRDRSLYHRLAKTAGNTVDLDLLETLARSGAPLAQDPRPVLHRRPKTVRIGVAQDQAFCFYYADNLELLEARGGELVVFSPLHDAKLPDALGMIYLGGGYPELHGPALAANGPMRSAIKRFGEHGGTIYAECGGMMYLTQGLRDCDGRLHEMVGLFPAEATMQRAKMTLGYRALEVARSCVIGPTGLTARGHEFHYSTIAPKGPLAYACTLTDAEGESKGYDGMATFNTLGLYTHLHFGSQPACAAALVDSARRTAQYASGSCIDSSKVGE